MTLPEEPLPRLLGYRRAVAEFGVSKATFYRLAVAMPGGGKRVARSVLERLAREAEAAGGSRPTAQAGRRLLTVAVPDDLS